MGGIYRPTMQHDNKKLPPTDSWIPVYLRSLLSTQFNRTAIGLTRCVIKIPLNFHRILSLHLNLRRVPQLLHKKAVLKHLLRVLL
jgi:hypothetical protein